MDFTQVSETFRHEQSSVGSSITMENINESNQRNQGNVQPIKCAICGTTINLLRCSKCKTIYYCSVAHQHLDWPKHKRQCRIMAAQKQNMRLQQLTRECGSINLTSAVYHNVAPSRHSQAFATDVLNMKYQKDAQEHDLLYNKTEAVALPMQNCDYLGVIQANSTTVEQIHAHQDTFAINTHNHQLPPSNRNAEFYKQQQQQQLVYFPQSTVIHNNISNQMEKACNYQLGTPVSNETIVENDIERRYLELCRNIISDMNQYGLSVVDDFLGMEKGMQIVNEVHNMYAAGVFKDGQLVNHIKLEQDHNTRTIRGDKITWVKGVESGCLNIGYLINQIDAVICKANTMSNNGKLGDYVIKERTKAMVACYPGSGSHYIMHVDNPNRDGRVITAIYYLNVNWDAKKNGGVLRIFPEKTKSVADIEPQFDRLIFFWSDKRNPHEVQPAHHTRYAITVWYFDANEREAALNRCKTTAKSDMSRNHNSCKININNRLNNRNIITRPTNAETLETLQTPQTNASTSSSTSSFSLMLAGNL